VPSLSQTIEISKLEKLTNIQISQPNKMKSGKIIGNMNLLNHITLGYDEGRNEKLSKNLLEEIEKLSELNSLSLVGVSFENEL
jgi:hypothetical protein